jgi:hypothetical protein
VDDTQFRIRVQACLLNVLGTACSNTTPTGRVLRLDDVRITNADETPGNQAVYELDGGGTSLAAPYFAGYAGLMKLATKRTGVSLTRQLMLAGTVPEPALAGKLITGGRLDVAKGLDFYLRTLPRLSVADTTNTAWNPGASVAYSFSVSDSAGPRNDFAFSAISGPPGGSLTANGLYSWSSAGAPNGNYVVRAKAVNGPITLRKMVMFSLGLPARVASARPGQASLLRIGGRSFLLPPSAFDRERRVLRIEFYGADGRTLRAVAGELTMPQGTRIAEYRLQGFQGVGLRAWLDGVALKPAPRE